MHYVFDCDDVLLDWQQGFSRFMSARGMDLAPEGPSQWDMADWIGCSPDAALSWVSRFNNSESFAYLNAMPGAYEAVWRLRDKGATIHVLTSCGEHKQRDRASNLNLAFGRNGSNPFSSLHCLPLGEPKLAALLDMKDDLAPDPYARFVFVEDRFENADSATFQGILSYCLRRSHNRKDEDAHFTDVHWIDNLNEVQ